MNRDLKTDRRRHFRFPQNLSVHITPLPHLGPAKSKSKAIEGRIHNISDGGMCVSTPRPLPKPTLLRCEIAICDSSIRFATLMQVRWIERQKLPLDRFLSGLAFLL